MTARTERDIAELIDGVIEWMRSGTVTVAVSPDPTMPGERYLVRVAHRMIDDGKTREYVATLEQVVRLVEVDPKCWSGPKPHALRTALRELKPPTVDVSVSSSPSKACSFCGEQILTVAIKCKHCGSMLVAQPAAVRAREQQRPAASDELGIVLAIIPWAGLFFCWFWVGKSPLITASKDLMTVGLVVTLSTALLAAVDASALQLDRKHGGWGPVGTFFGVALLWIVFYPVHMGNRSKAGVPSRLAPALIGALAFAALTVYFAVLINERLMELQRALGGL